MYNEISSSQCKKPKMSIQERFKHLEKTVNILKTVLLKSSKNGNKSSETEKDFDTGNNAKDNGSNRTSTVTQSSYQSEGESNYGNDDSNSRSEESDSNSELEAKPSNEQLEKAKSNYTTKTTWSTVEIKVEPLNVVFHKDVNGVFLTDRSNENVIQSSNSVEEAKKCIVSGLKPECYFECPYCSLLFQHPKRFLIHTKWHTFGLNNEQRLKLASQKNTMVVQKTKQREELAKTGHPCNQCHKVYTTRKILLSHKKKVHCPPEPVENKAPKDCNVCHKTFTTATKLKFHMTSHATVRAYQCTECPKSYKYASSLNNHLGSHMENIHACELCDKKFGSPKLLKLHVQRHEKVLLEPTHKCSYCPKMYRMAAELVVHERSHTNEKPFVCYICDSKYVSNSSLTRHIQKVHKRGKKKAEQPEDDEQDSEDQDVDSELLGM